MARAAVTYEQVAGVANALYERGIREPGTRAVREELSKRSGPGAATGSPNTIQRHLMVWRQRDKPLDPATPTPQLPPQVSADISRALSAAAAEAETRMGTQVSQLQAELDELAAAGEGNEERIEELLRDLAFCATERDSMAGQLAERTGELGDVKQARAAIDARAAELTVDLAAARAEAQAAVGRVEEIRQSAERQVERLERDVAGLQGKMLEIDARAVTAERLAAVLEAQLAAEREARTSLAAQLLDAQADSKRLQTEAGRASAAEAAVEGLREQVAVLQSMNDTLRALVRQSAEAKSAA